MCFVHEHLVSNLFLWHSHDKFPRRSLQQSVISVNLTKSNPDLGLPRSTLSPILDYSDYP